jgi:hypothetical protein
MLPEPRITAELWQRESVRAGLKGLFLVQVESHNISGDACMIGFDCSLEFQPIGSMPLGPRIFRSKWWRRHRLGLGENAFRDNSVFSYKDLVQHALTQAVPKYPRIPCVCPGWDNSPRRKSGASIFIDSVPELYGYWLGEIVKRQRSRVALDEDSGISPESLVFINGWNEWGEGNHLEPCQRWGRAYLEATQRTLQTPVWSPERNSLAST